MSSPLDRYRLIDQLLVPDGSCAYWRAYDTALDREVVIRLVHASDPRAEVLNTAARTAAIVQDRRLGQILDVMKVPPNEESPARIAVINEWINGESLLSFMAARDWNPLELQPAIGIVTEVAQALALAHELGVQHGRLLASNVLLTDAGEVRVIGMSIDAALLGAPHEDLIRSDIDALGGLLYLMLTGRSPFAADLFGHDQTEAPSAPRHQSHLEPPSHLRADIPQDIDVLIGRSMFELRRPRGTTKIRTVAEFLGALAQIRASIEPVAARPGSTRFRALAVRLTVVAVVLAGIALLVVAWRQLYIGPEADSSRPLNSASHSSAATPQASASGRPALVIIPAAAVTSFDPFGDDNHDGINDASAGHEHQNQASRAIDGKPATAWTSRQYEMANANGKGGVGLILDLGKSPSVQSVDLTFGEVGAAVRIGVSDSQLGDPNRWPVLAKAAAGDKKLSLRSPRAIAGRYVLLWFPRLPPSVAHPGMHQVRVSEIVVHGRG
ncbi:MAG: protein kinase [Actinomycetota bacterium]|nr:protein kinase [Actinomycetota bacterium]